jgi:hypothetical protein
MRESVRFLLGDELVEIASCDPTRTLLDWLRLDRRLHRLQGRLRRGRLRGLHRRGRPARWR